MRAIKILNIMSKTYYFGHLRSRDISNYWKQIEGKEESLRL